MGKPIAWIGNSINGTSFYSNLIKSKTGKRVEEFDWALNGLNASRAKPFELIIIEFMIARGHETFTLPLSIKKDDYDKIVGYTISEIRRDSQNKKTPILVASLTEVGVMAERDYLDAGATQYVNFNEDIEDSAGLMRIITPHLSAS